MTPITFARAFTGASLLISSFAALSAEFDVNKWRVFRDEKAGFSISYPDGWQLMQPRGASIKFSVSPASGAGNCNVGVKEQPATAKNSQEELNASVLAETKGAVEWASSMSVPLSSFRLLSSSRAKLGNVQSSSSKAEVAMENLQTKYTRVQYGAMLFTPGKDIGVTCGVSELNQKKARARFNELDPIFKNVMATFRLEATRP